MNILKKFGIKVDADLVDRLSKLQPLPGIQKDQLSTIIKIAKALRAKSKPKVQKDRQ